ncbi:Q_salvage domain-containing protein [Ktedonobacteria bacterium brp13]|nr:Q_salvage domain-containing protein [Ktedonobacteria bacterium brp13]
MAKLTTWHDEEDDLYMLDTTDPLGVLVTTRTVVELGENVWINPQQIERIAKEWAHMHDNKSMQAPSLWDNTYHFFDASPEGSARTVNWMLLLDALNFCFWSDKDEPRWTVYYQGETLNGYWAEAAALKRAVEEGTPLWDAHYLSTITETDVARIFRGNETIPLFAQRVANARETGRVLLERYDGQFINAIEQAHYDTPQLVQLLERDFPSFRDVTTYRDYPIRFLKRAQICVADLYGAFGGKDWGAFSNIDQLTIFADYKLPQVLRHYGILGYHSSLAYRVDNQELIASGSLEEIEIRACTVWACELLRRALQQYGQPTTAADIDQRLWLLGQRAQEMHPYHRTRTIFY